MSNNKNLSVPILILPNELAVDEQGFATLASNKVVVRTPSGETLATVGHRKRFEEVTLPDGRRTTAKVVTLWVRPEGAPPSPVKAEAAKAAAKPAKGKGKGKAAETGTAPAPAPSAEERLNRLEALILGLVNATK